MSAQNKYLKIAVIGIPALMFATSLPLDSFSYQYIAIETPKSYALLLGGAFAFLGGGLFESMVWSANPIAAFAVIRFFIESRSTLDAGPSSERAIPKTKPYSYWLSALAAGIALSFSLWNEVLAAESGSLGKILALHTGYWLWAGGFTLLSLGINVYHFQFLRQNSVIQKPELR